MEGKIFATRNSLMAIGKNCQSMEDCYRGNPAMRFALGVLSNGRNIRNGLETEEKKLFHALKVFIETPSIHVLKRANLIYS